jgi:hypothetical protein
MNRLRLTALFVLAALASPRSAAACAMCLSSAFGDRSFTWPYIGLIIAPFIVGVAIALALAWHAGWRRQDVTDRISAWTARLRHRPARTAVSPRSISD